MPTLWLKTEFEAGPLSQPCALGYNNNIILQHPGDLNMNVQRLNIILAALRCGSLTKAAEELGYTQSGLTYAINSFENELGLPVVIRDASGIRLSKDGEELLPYMEEMIAAERRLVDGAKEILSRRGNMLNVDAYPSMAITLLPELIAGFNSIFPDIHINIQVCSRDETVARLQSGMCDFGFGGQIHLPDCDWLPLLKDPTYAILPEDFPTDGMEAFPIAELKRHPFVRPVYWAEENEIASQLEAFGIEAQFVVNSPDNAPVIAMVEQGLAISAIPELTLLPNARIKALPLEPSCHRMLGVNYRRSPTEGTAAASFLKYLSKLEGSIHRA